MGDDRGRRITDRFVPLPPAVVDDWLPRLTGSQLKLLLVVVRQTEGYRDAATGGRKAEDWLTHRRLMALTGCASQAVSGAVDALVRADLVRVRSADGGVADTPERRRRAARLLYGLGPALLAGPDGPHGRPPRPVALKSGLRKPKITKEIRDKRSDSFIVFENREVESREPGAGAEGGAHSWVWRPGDGGWTRAGDAATKQRAP